MLRGLYTGASGMLTQQLTLDTISNNLANANTTGYRRDQVVRAAFPGLDLFRVNDDRLGTGVITERGLQPPTPIGGLGTGVAIDDRVITGEPGPLKETGNALDLAVVGDGLFAVQTPEGERYTRDGSFRLDAAGIVTTQDGMPVLGVDGEPIALPPGAGDVQIDEQGRIWADGAEAGQLLIVSFPDPARLDKVGDNRLAVSEVSGDPAPADDDVRVVQGFLEGSNVNAVRAMVNLISANRAYEANQRTIQAHDEALGKAVNEVGKLR